MDGFDAPGRTIAILGGGLSGAAVAYHLARANIGARIVVVEPRAEIGRGVAYSATDPDHRLNVPDSKMTIRTDILDDYARWLRRDGSPPIPSDAVAPSGAIFTSRLMFGDYVVDHLRPFLDSGVIVHRRCAATDVIRRGRTYLISLSDGTSIGADILVLALTHPRPAIPAALRTVAEDPRFIADPLAAGALDAVRPEDRAVIVGSGLTSADVIATLFRRGVKGKITCLSRHGWRSMPHGPIQSETRADFANDPSASARALLARVRASLAEDLRAGLTWHAIFDRLRSQGPAIWAALPEIEKRRLLRHLRSLWDVHRFRIAPQTRNAQDLLIDAGRLDYVAASLVSSRREAELVLTVRPRGTAERRMLRADHVILATGPAHATVIESCPPLRALAQAGLIEPDGLGLGIRVGSEGFVETRAGGSGDNILVAGPLARGTVGELMGVPEVSAWSEHVANRVYKILAISPKLSIAQ